ncbi:hypothetical protein BJ166DRAFT_543489 [Pestalotiopsis sp. NC0098]|nr:hypothetical protein BJ166DRAFT_543489 [Pestalotiopsis sp. NC0098]
MSATLFLYCLLDLLFSFFSSRIADGEEERSGQVPPRDMEEVLLIVTPFLLGIHVLLRTYNNRSKRALTRYLRTSAVAPPLFVLPSMLLRGGVMDKFS